jgi:hypothetical protein
MTLPLKTYVNLASVLVCPENEDSKLGQPLPYLSFLSSPTSLLRLTSMPKIWIAGRPQSTQVKCMASPNELR